MTEGLVARLVRIQEAHGWTDEHMASAMGVTRPMWTTVRSGRTHLGHRSLGSIVRHFPELREQVLAYLANEPEPETEAVA